MNRRFTKKYFFLHLSLREVFFFFFFLMDRGHTLVGGSAIFLVVHNSIVIFGEKNQGKVVF